MTGASLRFKVSDEEDRIMQRRALAVIEAKAFGRLAGTALLVVDAWTPAHFFVSRTSAVVGKQA
jgi:hypothetical protein